MPENTRPRPRGAPGDVVPMRTAEEVGSRVGGPAQPGKRETRGMPRVRSDPTSAQLWKTRVAGQNPDAWLAESRPVRAEKEVAFRARRELIHRALTGCGD